MVNERSDFSTGGTKTGTRQMSELEIVPTGGTESGLERESSDLAGMSKRDKWFSGGLSPNFLQSRERQKYYA